jgi:hypothetical protein
MRHLFCRLFFFAILSPTFAGIAPATKPLPDSELQKYFDTPDDRISMEMLHRALICNQTFATARAAEILGRQKSKSSIPFLIDALSNDTSYVGGGYACFGKPGQNTTRYWANESLKAITGKDFKFIWDADETSRKEAIERWATWYRSQI